MRLSLLSLREIPTFLHQLVILCFLLPPSWSQNYDLYSHSDTWTSAVLVLTYKHPIYKNVTTEKQEEGRFGTGAIKETKGILKRPIHSTNGCAPVPKNLIPKEAWIALVKQNGDCTPEDKMNSAEQGNASALIMIFAPDTQFTNVDFKGKIF